MNTVTKKRTLDELCALTQLNKRTVRFYIQQGLVDRPIGEKRGAYYSETHLEQLLTIQKWKEAGLSLERIKELLKFDQGEHVVPPLRPKQPGSVEVWSHIHIQDGLEINIQPERANMTPEQLRSFSQQVMQLAEQFSADNKGE
ncbi:MAG: MerR family transcriptional regulator [Gammaproteobacteria bacterium]|jgi:DNA-binding transcriptional MerR regulator|nr:MerR family transcriptional regulator [Gammaproteobacteria bacterium]MBT4811459.1 MerR family transcriptional regulator [Thiotrichales bacterium]MBT5373011.1 MerR family transcriptional regulator [Gammaproteobacteria bacterium]MBT7229466.1 MerR family transcriptional regulator [Gammaproteobacteria bacterium]